jgi:glycosyltransferase involved in cell wall biosynthesis
MRVNWLSYIDPFAWEGGGEAIARGLIDCGRRRGHEIRFSSVYPKPVYDFQNDEAINVLVDIHNMPRRRRRFPQEILDEVVQNRRYVNVDNAYCGPCDLDDYLPCNGMPVSPCPFKRNALSAILRRRSGLGVILDKRCPVAERTRVYERASLNVFLSPLHARVVQRMTGVPDLHAYVLRPLIDTAMFHDRGAARDIEYLFVGVISEAKGLDAMRQHFRDKPITLLGRLREGERVDFGTHIPHAPYEEVPMYMNRARHFVFLPRWPEPLGRVVIEAALCGCTLITNENVGATSFPFDIGDPDEYKNSADDFWSNVERGAS